MSGSSSSKKDNALVSACVRNPALLDQVSQSILEELVDEIALGIAFEIHRYNLNLLVVKLSWNCIFVPKPFPEGEFLVRVWFEVSVTL